MLVTDLVVSGILSLSSARLLVKKSAKIEFSSEISFVFWKGLPSVSRTRLSNFCSWFCSVYYHKNELKLKNIHFSLQNIKKHRNHRKFAAWTPSFYRIFWQFTLFPFHRCLICVPESYRTHFTAVWFFPFWKIKTKL